MQITNKMSPAVLAAATGMLQTFVPELSPQSLVAALKDYNAGKSVPVMVEKPLTRREAASLLSVSINSINRYLNIGLLRRIKIGPRIIRIDPKSIMALMASGEAED